MKDKNRYMFCSDCGYAFKEDEIFQKAYTNTAICLCRECALKLAHEITDQYVDIRETQQAMRQAEAEPEGNRLLDKLPECLFTVHRDERGATYHLTPTGLAWLGRRIGVVIWR